jgi:hypothetical protein
MPKGHESNQQILEGHWIVIWFMELPAWACDRKEIVNLGLVQRSQLLLVLPNLEPQPLRQRNDAGCMVQPPNHGFQLLESAFSVKQ